jgi:hypothetical protein
MKRAIVINAKVPIDILASQVPA